MIILDTTFLIDLLKNHSDLGNYLNKTSEKGIIIATTIFNEYELRRNAFQNELLRIEELLSNLKILSFSSTKSAVELYRKQKTLGKTVPEIDLLIASICIDNSGTLVTANITDFQNIEGLRFLDQNTIS